VVVTAEGIDCPLTTKFPVAVVDLDVAGFPSKVPELRLPYVT
jgi:hypothetical protein